MIRLKSSWANQVLLALGLAALCTSCSVVRTEIPRLDPAGGWLREAGDGEFEYAPAVQALAVEVTERDGLTILASGSVVATFDDELGALISYQKAGVEYLASPLRPNFWRSPSPAELAGPAAAVFARWQTAGVDSRAAIRTLSPGTERPFLGYDLDLGLHEGAPRGTVQLAWFMWPGGALELGFNLHPSTLPDGSPGEIPRVGMSFGFDAQSHRWQWHGRGPDSNTLDKLGSSSFGVFSTYNFTGTRTGVRRALLVRPNGTGLSLAVPSASRSAGGFELGVLRTGPNQGAAQGPIQVTLDVVSVGDLASEEPNRLRLFGNCEYTYSLFLEIL